VVVVLTRPGGPAEGALQSGDVIQSIDGVPLSSVEQFRDVELSRTPGQGVAIAGIRRRSPLTVTVTASDSAAQGGREQAPAAPDETGLVGRTVPGVGIEVVTVAAESPAARAGLQRGDLVVAADGQRAPRSADLLRAFRSTAPGTGLLLTVQRGSGHRVLALERR
jgi:S1-C subfamily serine protease